MASKQVLIALLPARSEHYKGTRYGESVDIKSTFLELRLIHALKMKPCIENKGRPAEWSESPAKVLLPITILIPPLSRKQKLLQEQFKVKPAT